VPGDTNGSGDIFVHDRDTDADGIYDEPGETSIEIVSVNSDGAQASSGAGYSSISADGRFVAFNSGATNLVPVDFNYWVDVFVHDRDTGETTLASHAMGGMADERSFWPSLSADGRYVAFHSYATDLVAGDTNGFRDVFLTDRGEIVAACPGDLDDDGNVGVQDFLTLLAAWGTNPGGPPDLNNDGEVGILDLLDLLAGWGPCS
jgi:Tol biopolymer transport system component